MKDSKNIISHLKKNPLLKNLEQQECFDILLSLLPKSFTQFIKFIYKKNDTIFFVLKHPSAKMEFNYKRNLIKELLNKVINFNQQCKSLQNIEIKAFVSNKKVINPKSSQSLIFYNEKAKGTFINNSKNEKLHELFEEIRKTIQSKST